MYKNKIKNGAFVFLVLFGQGLMAQATEQAGSNSSVWILENILLLSGVVVILGVVYSLFKINMMLLETQKLAALKEHGREVMDKAELLETKPLWRKAYDWSIALVPVGREDSIDLGHDYDGIRELDNRLPPWWLGIMYGSMIFAVIYMYQYHWGGSEWSSIGEYEMEMEIAQEAQNAYLDKMADNVNENTVVMLTEEADLAEGKSIFDSNCAACHGFKGEGLIGPNFTDEYWIHGGGIKNLFLVVKNGVPEKGMIAWKTQMGPAAMQKVSSYILTLQGTDPPNQKEREGELWVPESE